MPPIPPTGPEPALAAGPAAAAPRYATPRLSATPERIVSPYEFLPGWAVYGPVVAWWTLLGLRYGDFSLPTLANPHISTGGLCNESKSAILDQMDPSQRHWVAPYGTLLTGADDHAAAHAIMQRLGLGFPVVVKPDIGCKGAGVKLVTDDEALRRVLASFPRGIRLLVQAYIDLEGEAGIFYSRRPDEPAGRILSITLKASPTVTGDGSLTLRELIMAHPRAGQVPHLYLPRLADRLDEVPPAGRTLPLVFTGNHCRGSTFTDGTGQATPALTARIEAIARSLPDFHHGRIDLRFGSLPALWRGDGFRIIEINGVGSEATHIWDPKTRLREIYATQFSVYRRAFQIGDDMRRRGFRSRGIFNVLFEWRRQTKLIRQYPIND